ncbi:MAG TPA: WD40 repeat domain-containing protein [Gemmataceae bacterium]|nr:WD40 repeat domain-containing protein [Gemmataceae bacterium]
MAQVTIAFNAWQAGNVAPSRHEVPIVAPKSIIKLEPVSSRLKGELIHPNRTGTLWDIDFSPDGKRLVASDYPGGVVVVWDVATGKELTTIEAGYGYRSGGVCVVSPDWQTLFIPRGKRKAVAVEQGGKRQRRWEMDGDVRAFDLATGQLRRTYKHEPPRNILRMRLSPDGSRFLTFEELPGTSELGPRQAVSLWDVQTDQYRSLPANPQAVSFSPDGRTLAFAAADENDSIYALKLLELATGQEKLSIPIKDKYRSSPYGAGAVRFSPDGRTLGLATIDQDGYTHALKLFALATGREKLSIPIKDKNVWCAFPTFSSEGRVLVGDYQVIERSTRPRKSRTWLKWWDAETGAELGSFAPEDQNNGFFSSFSPDGHTLASLDWRGEKTKLYLFHGQDHQPAKTLVLALKEKGEQTIPPGLLFSPDGKWLVVYTQSLPDTPNDEDLDVQDVQQPRIHLIDVPAGEVRETLVAPQGFGRSLRFSPDGKTLATCGYGRVLLWDLARLPGAAGPAR